MVKKKVTSKRGYFLLKRYGITEEQYEEILSKQDGCCYLCLRKAEQFRTRLCVDHNHRTGEIRGILCAFCNHRVVGRHTDGDLLIRAGQYLKQGTGLFAPIRKKKRKKRKHGL